MSSRLQVLKTCYIGTTCIMICVYKTCYMHDDMYVQDATRVEGVHKRNFFIPSTGDN